MNRDMHSAHISAGTLSPACPTCASVNRLPHCTPTLGGHSPACDRDGTYCALDASHDGPCKPHGSPWPAERDPMTRCADCGLTLRAHWPNPLAPHLPPVAAGRCTGFVAT